MTVKMYTAHTYWQHTQVGIHSFKPGLQFTKKVFV